MVREVHRSTVVVTGASSGIGRATALLFAQRGANVVLAARREAPLRTLARACADLGVEAVPVPTDVSDEQAVRRLAARAWDAFTGLDTWVNAAAVAAFARFEATPLDVFRRVLETNVMGTVHGARAVVPYFRKQGGGVLVNVASILGKIAVPYLSAYNASKGAVVALSESLRQEYARDGIRVCTVLPPPTDTPFYQHAADYTGRVVRPPFPVYDAQTVAEEIVRLAERPRREVLVGLAPKLMRAVEALAPQLYDRFAPPFIARTMFEDAPKAPTAGNVFAPIPEGAGVSGGWKRMHRFHFRKRGGVPPPRRVPARP